MSNPLKNIGILAHVDAGKTSLTENFLYASHTIKSLGSVDKGNAITDSLNIEQRRGISIKTASEQIKWDQTIFNLIDTPGHTDFSAEVERILPVLDLAIVLISAIEGVQSNTVLLIEALEKLNIPYIIFINKIDRAGVNLLQCKDAIQKDFKKDVFVVNAFTQSLSEELGRLNTDDNKLIINDISQLRVDSIEHLANHDEEILNAYLEDIELNSELILQKANMLLNQKTLTPLIIGSAKYEIGISDLLNACQQLFPVQANSLSEQSAFVYRIEHHPQFGSIAHVKVISGILKARDQVYNHRLKKEQKIAFVKKYRLRKLIDFKEITAGDIGVICGIEDLQVGDHLGVYHDQKTHQLSHSVLNIKITACKDADYADLAKALQELNQEDPSINFKWYREEKEFQLNLVGPMQKEILQELIAERYQIDTSFSEPTIIYKETPLKTAEGFVRYWMPKPCWAIMKFKIEPGELGSGIRYESKIGVNDIRKKYQNEIEHCIPSALEQGIKGWNVTDLKVTLIEGEDHEIHSRPGDFNLATPMGIMRALENSGTQLLEPLFQITISCHEQYLGPINSELIQMRAQLDTPEFTEDQITIKATVPVATALDLNIKLNSICSGKFKLLQRASSYQVCPSGEGKIREFKGVNPLDESKWILHRRGAYRADER